MYLPRFWGANIINYSKNTKVFTSIIVFATVCLMSCTSPSSTAKPAPASVSISKDSLRTLWFGRNRSETDTALLSIGRLLQKKYSANNPDSLYIISRDMESTGVATSTPKWIAQARYSLGNYYYNSGNSDSSMLNYRSAIQVLNGSDTVLTGKIYLNIALIYSDIGQSDSARNYLLQALQFAQQTNSRPVLASIYSDLGANTQNEGNYLDALNYFNKSLEYGGPDDSLIVLLNLGLIFDRLRLKEEAFINNMKAVQIAERSTNLNTRIYSYIAMMGVAPNLTEVQYWMDKGLALSDSLNSPRMRTIILRDGGMYYLNALKLDTAAMYLNAGLALAREIQDHNMMILSLNIQLAKLDNERGNYPRSLQKCLEIQPLCRELGNPGALRTLSELLSKNYEALGQPAQALQYLHEKNKLDEEENTNKQLKSVLSAYLKDKSKNEIVSLQKDKEFAEASTRSAHEKARLSYWLFGLVSLFLSGLVLFYYTYFRQKNKAASALTLANTALIKEQEKLRRSNQYLRRFNSVVSHDILSNLDLILSTGNVLVDDAQQKPDRMMQYYQMTQQTGRQLKNYCLDLMRQASELQQVGDLYDPMPAVKEVLDRFGPALRDKGFVIDVNDLPVSPIPTAQVTQLFQNLVSNVLRYASDQKSPRLHIGSETDKEGNHCWIITDNGPGISDEKWAEIVSGKVSSDKGYGVGLHQLIESLQSTGAYMDMKRLSEGGTHFNICFTPSII